MSTPADDLVSGLLAAIEQREKLAEAATAGPWRYNPGKEWHAPTELAFPPEMRPPGEEFVGAGPLDATACVAATGPTDHPQSMVDAAFIAVNDPQAVLRLCRAHRKIIEQYCDAQLHAELAVTELGGANSVGRAAALLTVVEALAEGYGLSEEGNDERA